MEVGLHVGHEFCLGLLVENVYAVRELSPDRLDEVGERRLLGLDQGLVLLEGMGLKEERRHADGEGLFEGV